MKHSNHFQQAPVHNDSIIGAQVYSHSGEFSPQVFDLELPARGITFQFVRKYRSAQHQHIGPMGRGWTFTYAKWLEQEGNHILYHDGFGRKHRFTAASEGSFTSPPGFYAVLTADNNSFLLKQRAGDWFVFEPIASGGRLLAIADRNGNALRFTYTGHQVQVTDPLGRQLEITLELGRVSSLKDFTGRTWSYIYDENACLVEVVQPLIQGVPDLPRVRYAYDESHRLISITDPKGQTFLRNTYDAEGRIKKQEHGDGTFEFEYKLLEQSADNFPVFSTTLTLKNGGQLILKHDASGHVTERTLMVSARFLSGLPESAEQLVPLTIKSTFNRHGELVRRTYPAGNATEWVYDEEQADQRAQGNLLSSTQFPVLGSEDNPAPLATHYTYEPVYQQVTHIKDPRGHTKRFEYDAHGNLSKKIYPNVTIQPLPQNSNEAASRQVQLIDQYEYNEAGQLIRFTDPSGASIAYFYYAENAPSGDISPNARQALVQTKGGYLARIVRDPATGDQQKSSANLANSFSYDEVGNVTAIWDGKHNPTRLEYDAHNHLIQVTARKPYLYTATFQYDANGNMAEAALSFDHYAYDPLAQMDTFKTTALCQRFEYNLLNNIVKRSLAAGDREQVTRLVRDAAENVIREIQPLGNTIEYEYEERNKKVTRRQGVGSSDETEMHYTYTANGRLAATTSAKGHKVTFYYDGFHRYEGFTNPIGTMKKQWRDETGNVIRMQVIGETMTCNDQGEPAATQKGTLLESWFHYDECNRLVRMDRAWRDPATGAPLGSSHLQGKEGMISSVVQYGQNHLPAHLWLETGNVLHFQYDGASRLIALSDDSGESVSVRYDENSNPVRVERLGHPVNDHEQPFRQVISQQYDELDRVVSRSVNDLTHESYSFNGLGALVEYKNQSGATLKALYDVYGRFAGGQVTAGPPASGNSSELILMQRFEWDDNDRLVARVNARGYTTRYLYDALNRLSGRVYADGTTKQFTRDAEGNITQVLDANGTIITNLFDEGNRLVEQSAQTNKGEKERVRSIQYDGLNRIIAVTARDITTLRRYDSLSRLLEETQSGFSIRYQYDAAGNRVVLSYPGGREVHKTYDILRRVSEVRDQDGTIASYTYGVGAQMHRLQLGSGLQVLYAYDAGRDRLQSIIYQSVANGAQIEGTIYRYDNLGNRIQEVRLRRGEDFGDRYFYDEANRLFKVQYGVLRLSDPASRFEREDTYELNPTGAWDRKTTKDAAGNVLEQVLARINQRERYISLGNRRFQYDTNGNRILEDSSQANGSSAKRYTYDHANRLIRVEKLDGHGQPTQSIDYTYDAFGRQVRRSFRQDNTTRETVRVWNGDHLLEEWEDGKLVRSFVYGSRVNEPIKLLLFTDQGTKSCYYVHNGQSSTTALLDEAGNVVEGYSYDAAGQVFLSEQNGQPVNSSVFTSVVGNNLLAGARIYDADAGLTIMKGDGYDPISSQLLSAPGSNLSTIPWTPAPPASDSVSLYEEGATGGFTANHDGAPLSMPIPKSDDPVQMGEVEYWTWVAHNLVAYGLYTYFMGRLTGPLEKATEGSKWAEKALKVGKWGIGKGFEKLVEALQNDNGLGKNGSTGGGLNGDSGMQSNWSIPYALPEGEGSGFPGGSSGGSSGSGGGTSGSSGTGGNTPEDRPFGNGVDYGTEGGGSSKGGNPSGTSGTTTGTGSPTGSSTDSKNNSGTSSSNGQKEHKPVLDPKTGEWVYEDTGEPVKQEDKKDAGTNKGSTPNPIDGTGEGIDKDWWRDLPYANPLKMAEALRSPVKVDEREQTPYLNLGTPGGMGYLVSVLTPKPVSVDEGGETLTINLQGVQSASTSAGISTSEGWGDKPRSLAEAYAAPRIRDAATSSF